MYNVKRNSEKKRFVVFVLRTLVKRKQMAALTKFFDETKIKKEIVKAKPYFFEQATRQFFYKGSQFDERVKLIKENMDFLTETFSEDSLRHIYVDGSGIELWSEEYLGKKLSFQLKFSGGQQKEGTLSIILKWDKTYLYQMMFWIAKDMKTDQYDLFIGAMQGPNVDNANEIIKVLTKQFFGYRTKNLILYATRAFARAIGVTRIYAVTNEGYYANNHIRIDRKLKTSFNDFWAETGGTPCEDKRFYELPLTEYRKTLEEVKTHKRNLYRKRFEVLDRIDLAIHNAIKKCLRAK
ncbi:MAG: VirK/YbjX family protein [Acidaminococcaceae bacterium]